MFVFLCVCVYVVQFATVDNIFSVEHKIFQ